jgi:hypothetical protein
MSQMMFLTERKEEGRQGESEGDRDGGWVGWWVGGLVGGWVEGVPGGRGREIFVRHWRHEGSELLSDLTTECKALVGRGSTPCT